MLLKLLSLFDFKGRRRARVRKRPFPASWEEILRRNVAHDRLLPPEDRRELREHILVFLDEKTFEGVGGLEMTDEVRVTIAAEACLLLLHRETNYYPGLSSVIVYPSRYLVEGAKMHRPDGTVVESDHVRLGESWHRGNVVLAWDAARHGARVPHDGHNVVLHEFAHQLDGQWAGLEGAPALPNRSMYAAWARVLGCEYERLVEDVSRYRDTLLGEYAATSPAEFFAVVTEVFFERPGALREHHPDLYEQMKAFYRQDPDAWGERSDGDAVDRPSVGYDRRR